MIQKKKSLPIGHAIRDLFCFWIDFQIGKFSYDGATFCKRAKSVDFV